MIGGYKIPAEKVKIASSTLAKLLPKSKFVEVPDVIHRYSGREIEIRQVNNHDGFAQIAITFPGLSIYERELDLVLINQSLKILSGLKKHGALMDVRSLGSYSIDYLCYFYDGVGVVALLTSAPEDAIKEVIERIISKIRLLSTELVDQTEVGVLVENDVDATRNIFGHNGPYFDMVAGDILRGVKPLDFESYRRLMERVTPHQIRTMAQRIFDFSKVNIIVLSGKDCVTKSDIERLLG